MIVSPKPDFKVLLILIICLLTPLLSYQQTKSGNKVLLRDFRHHIEDIYKYDDLLINGNLYRPNNTNAEGNPYFLDDKLWKRADIYVKGREFLNKNVLYNIETDELVTNVIFPDGESKNIILDQKFIDSIFIETHFFINVSPYTKESINALFEQVFNGNFKALLKHSITYKRVITFDTPNGYYDKPVTTLFLLQEEKLVKISGKKSLLNHFTLHKKEIARYIRNKKIKLKSAKNHELFNLFKFCDDISHK